MKLESEVCCCYSNKNLSLDVMRKMIQPKCSAMLALQDLTQVIVVKMCTDNTPLSILLANVKGKVSEIVNAFNNALLL